MLFILTQVGEGGSAFVSTSQDTQCHPLSLQSAYELVLRAFRAAAEREVTVGDAVRGN